MKAVLPLGASIGVASTFLAFFSFLARYGDPRMFVALPPPTIILLILTIPCARWLIKRQPLANETRGLIPIGKTIGGTLFAVLAFNDKLHEEPTP